MSKKIVFPNLPSWIIDENIKNMLLDAEKKIDLAFSDRVYLYWNGIKNAKYI